MMTGAGWKGFVERDMMGHTWLLTHCVPSSPPQAYLWGSPTSLSQRDTPLSLSFYTSLSLCSTSVPVSNHWSLFQGLEGCAYFPFFQFHLLSPI